MKQTDELEKVFLEKFTVIENLIESTKNTISQIQSIQYETANNANKDINDVSFNCRLSTAQNINLSLPHKDRQL